MRTAYSIARTGTCRVRGEHLLAANQACARCTHTCNQGRDCEMSRAASRAALLGPLAWLGARVRRHAWILRPLATYALAALIGLLMAAAPAILDGQDVGHTPQGQRP